MHRFLRLLYIMFLSAFSITTPLSNAHGQETTGRVWRPANLETDDYIKHINVSPDGTIWLLNAETGNAVYRHPTDSEWHYGPSWKSAEDDHHLLFGQSPEVMLFADASVAVIGGAIHTGGRGAILRTTDSGRNWQEVSVGDFERCNVLCIQPGGSIWAATGKTVYYSADKGVTWQTRDLTTIDYTLTCIAMKSPNRGIMGTKNGQLYNTTDNWTTVTPLAPPEINKATQQLFYWQGYTVLQSNNKWHIADTNTQRWQLLNGSAVMATTDSSRQILYTIDTAGRILAYQSPIQYAPICTQTLPSAPQDVQWQNGNLYILTQDLRVWIANEKGITLIPLHTNDRPMTPPEPIYKGSYMTWGTNGRQVLANTGKGWYRVRTVPFRVGTILPDTGNTALLWGGGDEQYVVDAITGNISTYNPQKPLQAFLHAPITSVTISSITSGCFYTEATAISYQQKKDALLVATEIEKNTNAMQQKDTCSLSISPAEWQRVLATINANPQYRPTMKDFNISDMDKVAYTEATDRLTYHTDDNTALMTLAEWNTAMPAVDTVGAGLLHQIVNRGGSMVSTTSTTLSVALTNETGDTIILRHRYYISPSPWLLPFYLFYKGHMIACYQPTLAKCITDALPDNFPGKSACHNYVLMMAAARQIMGKNDYPD